MRDRLIELIAQIEREYAEYHSDCEEAGVTIMTSFEDMLADHLLAEGVIVPPCKVGDTVYKVVNDKRVKKPYECKVVGFWYSADERCNNVHLVRYVNDIFDSSFSIPFADFGKTVFLTREEAEKALERRENDNT